MENNKLLTVSIIVPVRNESGYIVECIESIINSVNYIGNYEIIIVDNGSEDDTVKKVEALICKYNQITLYNKNEGTIASVRMEGYRKSKGKIVAFVDGDSVVPEGWMSSGLKILLASEDVSAVGFAVKPPEANSTWIERTWYKISSGRKWKGTIEVPWLPSFNLIVRRDYFDEINGFNESLETCEDADLGYRLHKISRLIYSDSLQVAHLGTVKNIKQFIKKELWRGSNNFRSLITSRSVAGLPSILLPVVYTITNIILIGIFTAITFKHELIFELILCLTVIALILLFMTARSRLTKPIDIFNAMVLLHVYLLVRGAAIVYRK